MPHLNSTKKRYHFTFLLMNALELTSRYGDAFFRIFDTEHSSFLIGLTCWEYSPLIVLTTSKAFFCFPISSSVVLANSSLCDSLASLVFLDLLILIFSLSVIVGSIARRNWLIYDRSDPCFSAYFSWQSLLESSVWQMGLFSKRVLCFLLFWVLQLFNLTDYELCSLSSVILYLPFSRDFRVDLISSGFLALAFFSLLLGKRVRVVKFSRLFIFLRLPDFLDRFSSLNGFFSS